MPEAAGLVRGLEAAASQRRTLTYKKATAKTRLAGCNTGRPPIAQPHGSNDMLVLDSADRTPGNPSISASNRSANFNL
jgi:hypothetical protein